MRTRITLTILLAALALCAPGLHAQTSQSGDGAGQKHLDCDCENQPGYYPWETTAINFVGDANLQKSLTNGDKLPVATGIGVVYREWLHGSQFSWLFNFELEAAINIATTLDTIHAEYLPSGVPANRADFGNSLLLPVTSGEAFFVNFRGYFGRKNADGERLLAPVSILSGLYAGFAGANHNWADSVNAIKAGVVAYNAGVFHEFVGREHRENYSITLGFGITGRYIAGNISQDENREFRHTILRTYKKHFAGPEVSLGIRLRNIRAAVKVPILLTAREDVPGLTGLQPLTSIGFVGGFALDLGKPNRSAAAE